MASTILPKFDIKFLFSHPAHFFAMGFGSGLVAKAPGTFGTLVGLPIYLLICGQALQLQLVIISALFIIGIYFCHKTGQDLGVADHGSMVWDEIVAIMLVLTFTPNGWVWWLLAFGLFRLFDIWKPFPIRHFDLNIKGGFGVMFDDLLAAVYAIIAIKAILWMLSQSYP
jgi:phosphatidylglycerophosphatase A